MSDQSDPDSDPDIFGIGWAEDEDQPSELWTPREDTRPAFEFLTGQAGTGKTFLAKDLARQHHGWELVATTGIAAINLGGTTINALLRYFDTKSLVEAYTVGFLHATLRRLRRCGLRRIVLDETSMLDGDQLTVLVRALNEINGHGYQLGDDPDEAEEEETQPRGKPEVRLLLVGDFAQLPPVKAPYAFESPEWSRFVETTTMLTEVRRQGDPDFICVLQASRVGDWQTVCDYFGPRLQATTDEHFEGPTLFARNESVERYNQLRLDKVLGAKVSFTASRWGQQRSEWKLIPEMLSLKIGALVMVLANARDLDNPKRFIYVNGDLGTVQDTDGDRALVHLHRTDQDVWVTPVQREMLIPLEPGRREELKKLGQASRIKDKSEIVGAITYLPLRVAYGTTVHKSQGLSLDQVQINLHDHFFSTPGMLYVALSRARTATGLRLVGTTTGLRARCTVNTKVQKYL